MKRAQHREQSAHVLAKLSDWGLSPDVQQRIGAFVVVWGIFEANLEVALWKMTGENVAGVRPSTDKTPMSDWIARFPLAADRFPREVCDVLQLTAYAATDLMDYRHALLHGSVIPFTTTFIRNPSWHGEVRKRPSNDAHVDANLLDMAIDAARVLCAVVFAVRAACEEGNRIPDIAKLEGEVNHARSLANELRHLTELVNHEKY